MNLWWPNQPQTHLRQGCQVFLINECQIIRRIVPKMPTRELNNAKLKIKALYTIISKKDVMVYQQSHKCYDVHLLMYLVRCTCIPLLNILNVYSVTTKFLQQFEEKCSLFFIRIIADKIGH